MADKIKYAEDMVMVILRNKIATRDPSEEDILEAINSLTPIIDLNEQEKTIVENSIKAKLWITMDLGIKIVDIVTYKPWLDSRKAEIDPYYWNRYRDYLLREKGWNKKIVDKLGDVSDEILNLLGNPKEQGIWKIKGLILGDVQSGKTSNYTALCNKAADAGYKVIILLTGTLEPLRKQTQERIDAGFIGLNSRNVLNRKQELRFIGVGLQDKKRTAVPFTNILQDFNSSILKALNFTLSQFQEPMVLVVKKNKRVLNNLEAWLRTCNTDINNDKIDLPLLLIDDEADNASVNTKKEDEDPAAINDGIKTILNLFRRSSYVAVTATPFANIFINPDNDKDVFDSDLFPSDFIYALSPPSNYIGSNAIFGTGATYESCLEVIEDAENYFRSDKKSAHIVPELPQSVKVAICYFFLANSIRDLTGNVNTHRSMLVNVSQYVNVQDQVYDYIDNYVKLLKNSIQNYSKLDVHLALKNKEISFLYEVWSRYDLSNITGLDWEKVQLALFEATMPIQMKLVNQKAKSRGIERLDYEPYRETGLRVIAVGGNSLSRGLTLEGLCASYFYRNSQMYDTLMQMGRWFGYRDGYDGIFKIWMASDAIVWYQYITRAINELREEISDMNRVNLTPRDFGLKVRQDINSLFVTARNKMRYTSVSERLISVAAELIETPRLIANRESLLSNIKATNDLIELLFNNGYNYTSEQKVFHDVPKEIIAEYIRVFSSHPRHIPFSPKDLSNYIYNAEHLQKWDVAIIGGEGERIDKTEYFSEKVINIGICPATRVMTTVDNCLLISGQRARVGAPGCTKAGLDDSVICEIEKKFRETHDGKTTIPDKPFLQVKRNPVLLIHILNINKDVDNKKKKRVIDSDIKSINLVGDMPVIALGLGFPGVDGNDISIKVKYVINRIEERNYLMFEEDDELYED